jgi:hypothetical protein
MKRMWTVETDQASDEAMIVSECRDIRAVISEAEQHAFLSIWLNIRRPGSSGGVIVDGLKFAKVSEAMNYAQNVCDKTINDYKEIKKWEILFARHKTSAKELEKFSLVGHIGDHNA